MFEARADAFNRSLVWLSAKPLKWYKLKPLSTLSNAKLWCEQCKTRNATCGPRQFANRSVCKRDSAGQQPQNHKPECRSDWHRGSKTRYRRLLPSRPELSPVGPAKCNLIFWYYHRFAFSSPLLQPPQPSLAIIRLPMHHLSLNVLCRVGMLRFFVN